MIYLTAGTPGAGKTLFTLDTVDRRARDEGREVYYYNVTDLTLPWHRLDDPKTWNDLPVGSIIVIDEAWQVFPVRKQGSEVPEFVGMLAKHRHKGYDIYLVTQDPTQLDTFVRKQVGEYRYLDRPYGNNYAVVWRFSHVCDWKSGTERAGADQMRWSYPKERFGIYKSAEVHTHKRTVPRRLLYLAPLLLLLVVCGVVGYRALVHSRDKAGAESVSAKAPGRTGDNVSEAGSVPTLAEMEARRRVELLEYARRRFPRVPDAPESAPMYDDLSKPVVFPVIAGCTSYTRNRVPVCQCFSQQGTPIVATAEFCGNFVAHGAFNPYLQTAEREGARAAGDARLHDKRGEQMVERGKVGAAQTASVKAIAAEQR